MFLNNHVTPQQMAAAASLHQQPRNGQVRHNMMLWQIYSMVTRCSGQNS